MTALKYLKIIPLKHFGLRRKPQFHAKMHFIKNTVFSSVINECHVIHLKTYPYSMKQIDPKRQPTQTKILTCFFLSWTSLLNLTLCKCLENEKFRSLSNLRLSLNKRHRFIFTIPPLKMLLLFFFEWWLITSPSQLQQRYPPF